MRVGLEDIDVTSCLNVCIVVIIVEPPPGVTLYVVCDIGRRRGVSLDLSLLDENLSKKSWSRLSNKDNNNELLCQ